jgi:radical SAM protein with 4Fe4S-binding SPASM domain
MTPGQQQNRSEYGGCQAGNSLGHVDTQGVVHPCAAWPQPLGQLPDQTLEDVWAGAQRLAVREHISRTPEGCHDCTDLGLCFGGCRGLAFHLNRSKGERDLMCSGSR